MPKNIENDNENTIFPNTTVFDDTDLDEDNKSINNFPNEENSFNFTIEEKVILGKVFYANLCKDSIRMYNTSFQVSNDITFLFIFDIQNMVISLRILQILHHPDKQSQ